MTTLQKQAFVKLIVCASVLAVVSVIFFASGGAETFAHDKSRILLMSVFLGIGFAAIFGVLFLDRGKRRKGAVLYDERDERIVRLANGSAFMALAVYVFVASIALWVFHQERGTVPAGWMWFLAYTSVFLGVVFHSAMTLILYGRMDGHGETGN